MKTLTVISVCALLALSVEAMSQGTGMRGGRGCGRCTDTAFVDKNNNGVCDHREARQGYRRGCHRGDSTFVDKNSNGICDRREARGDGRGSKRGCCGKGDGKGRGFVDANNNGICDHAETKN